MIGPSVPVVIMVDAQSGTQPMTNTSKINQRKARSGVAKQRNGLTLGVERGITPTENHERWSSSLDPAPRRGDSSYWQCR
jgi:hypothetical protein